MSQTIDDIRNAIAKDSTLNEVVKDLIKENEAEAQKRLSLYTRYKGDKSTIQFEEALDPAAYNGVPIYTRKMKSDLKVNHKLHAPFIGKIVLNMVGYIGTVDIGIHQQKYTNPDDPATAPPDKTRMDELIKGFMRTNSMNKVHGTFVEDADCTGCAYGLVFQDDGELYFKRLKPWETIVIRNAQTEFPEYGMRYWTMKVGENWRKYVEFYDGAFVYYLLENRQGNFEFNKLVAPEDETKQFTAGRRPHLMGFMPIIEFPKNEQKLGDPERTLSMQDAFNISLSDFSSELAQLRQAYLARKSGIGKIDQEFLALLKQSGILIGEWEFVVKSLNPEAVKYHQGTLKQLIFDLSNSVDFSDPAFAAAMPIIAFKLKCKGLDDSATQIINEFTDSYFYLFEILTEFWKTYKGAPATLQATDLTVTINKNLPINVSEVIKDMETAGVKLSQKTGLELFLPQLGVSHTVEEEESRIEEEGNSETSKAEDFFPNTKATTGQTLVDDEGMDGGMPGMTEIGKPKGTTGRRKDNA